MKVLVLAPTVPEPVTDGGRLRTAGLVRCLARFATVQVLAVAHQQSPDVDVSRQALAGLGATLRTFTPTGPGPLERDPHDLSRPPDALSHFRCPELTESLPGIVCEFRPDAVHVEELVMAQYVTALPSPRVIDRQKVEWSYLESLAASAGGARPSAEAERFRRWERTLVADFDATLVLGEGDRRLLAGSGWPDGRIHVVPNGVRDDIVAPAARSSGIQYVLLYGTLDYPPNAAANAFYFREVWPALRTALPELRTLVVGAGRPGPDLPASDPRVELLGFVPDVRELLQGPGVLVVPLRVGGGIRNKVLEALAAGMPVVSTAVGAEDLGLEPGRHYLNAETAGETVEAVVGLSRDPALVRSLGLEGVRRVEDAYRWDRVCRALESIYGGLVAARCAASKRPGRSRVLLAGVRPLPEDREARGLGFPGHRTAQFRAALEAAGCEVEAVLLDEEPGAGEAAVAGGLRILAPERYRAGRDLQRLHDAFEPAAVVSAGGYHAARVVSRLTTRAPRWIDLPGDLAAEGQARAARSGGGAVHDHLGVLALALSAGDRFSVVGPSQRLALLGQLGLAGRLPGERLGQEPVEIVPLACDGPAEAPPLPGGPLRILWSGGYNTWMDEATLFEGLEQAMAARPDIVFTSTGGAIPGHEEEAHRSFWERVRGSRHAARFLDLGRQRRGEALETLRDCHLVLCVSRPCLEAELGSRMRLVEAAAFGRAAVATDLGDSAREIAAAGAGLAVPAADAKALAAALLRLAGERELLDSCSRNARRLWQERWTFAATGSSLRAWVEAPTSWPRSLLDERALAALASERSRLQGELDEIRGSHTFRALRLLDRVLGRGGR